MYIPWKKGKKKRGKRKFYLCSIGHVSASQVQLSSSPESELELVDSESESLEEFPLFLFLAFFLSRLSFPENKKFPQLG